MALNDSNRNKVRLNLYWPRDWIPHGIQDWIRDWIPDGIQDWIQDWIQGWIRNWIPDGIQDWIQDWIRDWIPDGIQDWLTFMLSTPSITRSSLVWIPKGPKVWTL